jgi:hypothetical protein
VQKVVLNPRNPNEYVLAFNEDRKTNEAHVYFALHHKYIAEFKKVVNEWADKKKVKLNLHWDGIGLDDNTCRHHQPPERERVMIKSLDASHYRTLSSSDASFRTQGHRESAPPPPANNPYPPTHYGHQNFGPPAHHTQQQMRGGPQYNFPEMPNTRSPVLLPSQQQAMMASCQVGHPQELASICIYCTGAAEYPRNVSLPTRPPVEQQRPQGNTESSSRRRRFLGL